MMIFDVNVTKIQQRNESGCGMGERIVFVNNPGVPVGGRTAPFLADGEGAWRRKKVTPIKLVSQKFADIKDFDVIAARLAEETV